MQVYEVGGAVRDSLLGKPVRERDWVVVGATARELLDAGYRPVGSDFPVFLHPETGEEYALARTERKTGPGYTGFEFDTRSVSLEEDLMRRDLTINAIARTADGQLIDPYGGLGDLDRRVLRHVSDAFSEDPLRVLRVARFAAQLSELGFAVAPETQALLARMAVSGELEALRPERIWLETRKALLTPRPDVFITVLRECGALSVVYPEIDRLFGVPQPEKWHPEIDTGVHLLMALRMAARLSDELAVRFAVLVHDLGKGTTPMSVLPSHRGHERRSVELIGTVCMRLPVPTAVRHTAELVAEHHGRIHRAMEMRPGRIFELLLQLDALRQPERLESILVACEADARGRRGLEESAYPQAARIRKAARAAASVRYADVPGIDRLDGPAVGEALRRARLSAVTAACTEFDQLH
ncbi:MAG: multifunctional CCA addition/repair protein [Gammaproteobacteria bacterium]|jgi:tRNA nucleotidyltransferase (CCA-adding enzyme)